MFDALTPADLDALDPAALKAIILAQRDHYEAQQQTYTATLDSRASEIERLKLLVEKLQRMLFGTKSEKVLPADRTAAAAAGRTAGRNCC